MAKKKKKSKRHNLEYYARKAGAKVPALNNRLAEAKNPLFNFVKGDGADKDFSLFDMYILEHITQSVISKGYAPTINELLAYYGTSNSKEIRVRLKRLENNGFIKIDHGLQRAIRIEGILDPKDQASQRIKQWLMEAIVLLRRHTDTSLPDIKQFLNKSDIFSF